jgi:hypothetical protein
MTWGLRTSRQIGGYVEVLASSANADLKKSIVLDATSVAPDVNGDRILKAGTLLSKNATTEQYERFTAAAGQAIVGVLATDEVFADGTSMSDRDSQMWNHGQEFRADRIVDWATHAAAARTALPTCRFI